MVQNLPEEERVNLYFIITTAATTIDDNDKAVPLQDMKEYKANRGIAPLILNLGTR
jgi:hypothetical protein